MKKLHKDWFYMARSDLDFAKSGFNDGFYSHVCFLSQQAVEKSMKGFLVYQGKDYPKTHGLVMLHKLMEVNWLDGQLSAIKKLSEFYVPLRYPDAFPGSLPEGLPDKEDAQNALKWAEVILTTIEKYIETKNAKRN